MWQMLRHSSRLPKLFPFPEKKRMCQAKIVVRTKASSVRESFANASFMIPVPANELTAAAAGIARVLASIDYIFELAKSAVY